MDTLQEKANQVLKNILANEELSKYVDDSLPIPKPYVGSGSIKLVVIGQDPTIKNEKSRENIKTVLNLDKNRSITAYLSGICINLGIKLRSNVYATNLYKNFFIDRPTTITQIDVFQRYLDFWLPLLLEELNEYPNIPVITLGEPILNQLLLPGTSIKVRDYWGYDRNWKIGISHPFNFVKPKNNKLDRILFPYPHQPSIRKKFYKSNIEKYTFYMKDQVELSLSSYNLVN